MTMKSSRYDVDKANQRCSIWLQNQNTKCLDGDESMGEDDPDDQRLEPLTDPLKDSDEDLSNQSGIERRAKRSSPQDETLSELSEISQERYNKSHRRQITDVETDVSLTSEDVFVRKPKLVLRAEKFELVCEWRNCYFVTSDVELFVKHVAAHVPDLEVKCSEQDNEEVYSCQWESCDFETPNGDEVVRHVNFHSYHTKVKFIGSLVCKNGNLPECSHGGAGKNLVPDSPQPFQCLWNKCFFTSNNPNIFYSHVHLHSHEVLPEDSKLLDGKKFKCLWQGCKSLVRNNRVGLLEHFRGHTKERVVACPTCGVLYASRMKLIDHIKRQMTSEESMTHQCTHCSRSFSSERLLRDHMRHHVNHFKCQFCDMTCPTQYALTGHIRHRHLDEKPFACDQCDYRAKTQYNVRRHMATHSTVNNFFCEEDDCNFTCRTLSILNWHYRKKHDVPPVYCCHMCATKFARGAYLTQHLMKKHNFRWPSGHTRFRFYKNHEDGLFRLQTVRYESLDVFEDINRQEGEPSSVLCTSRKFTISKDSAKNDDIVANFVVSEENNKLDHPDDPDDPDPVNPDYSYDDNPNSATKVGQSMPSLDQESSPKKVLICIDEVDKDGNIISSKTMEVDELLDMQEVENALIVTDGSKFENLTG